MREDRERKIKELEREYDRNWSRIRKITVSKWGRE
jgi:hypothetical protein